MPYSPWYVELDYWLTGYAEGDGFLQLNAELQKIALSAVIELFQLELIVIGWVKEKLNVEEIEDSLQAQLDKKNAPTTATGLPWS